MPNRLHIRKTVAFLFFTISFYYAKGQQQLIPLNPIFELEAYYSNHQLTANDSNYNHLGFKPLLESRLNQQPVSVNQINIKSERSYLARKLFFEHFIQLETEEIRLTINPLLNVELGEDFSSEAREVQHYKNMRGFILQVDFGRQVSVRSTFRENQVVLPNYLHDRTKNTDVAYGQGRVKQFGTDGYDFAMASSYISYSPSTKINFQLGTGKHFIGNGHRSLLLSDWTFNYPYLKSDLLLFKQKVNYQNLYAIFQNLDRLPAATQSESLFERKAAAFHYLNFAFSPRWSIALFEGYISTLADSSGSRGLSGSYYAPIIFLNHFVNADDKIGNSMLGVDWRYLAFNNATVYGQIASTYGENELGYQFGLNYYFGFFPARLRLEYNKNNHQSQMFSHYNESIASPAPSGSEEYHASLIVKKNRWLSEIAANQQVLAKYQMSYAQFTQSYIVNPTNQLALSLGYQMRTVNAEYPDANYLFFALRTNLQSLYFDY